MQVRRLLGAFVIVLVFATAASAGVLDWLGGLFGGAAQPEPGLSDGSSVTFWTVVSILLQLLGAFSLIAKLTPTAADDAIAQKILDFVHLLGLTKSAAKPPGPPSA